MEDDTGNLIGLQTGLGDIKLMARTRIEGFCVDKQYDHQEGFFLNRLITDWFWEGTKVKEFWEEAQSTFKARKCLMFQSNFQQEKLRLNKKQWDRGGRKASTKDLACSSVENF